MIAEILGWLSSFAINLISSMGYFGVFILMALESACIPIPSEIIMPFSGYLVFTGKFSFWLVVLWGTVGNLIGSIIAYFAGYYGGRPFIEKYGKYVLIDKEDLDKAQKFFGKYGNLSIFSSRLLPVVRTFISLPAGISKMPFWKFCFFTFFGSLPWSVLLTWVGFFFGENWGILEKYFKKLDWLILFLIIIVGGWWVWSKFKNLRAEKIKK